MDKNELVDLGKEKTGNKNKPLGGFTLVEVIVAAMILALVVTGLVYVFFAVRVQSVHANTRILVAELAKYYLTTLSNEVRQDQWGSNCLSGGISCWADSYDNYALGNMTIGGRSFTPYYCITASVDGTSAQKVKLMINWTEPSY